MCYNSFKHIFDSNLAFGHQSILRLIELASGGSDRRQTMDGSPFLEIFALLILYYIFACGVAKGWAEETIALPSEIL